jgi:thioredoxin reductase (NADPH)
MGMGNISIPENVQDVIIIGGGPAGFTAGLYASRAGLRTLLLEGSVTMSQISYSELVENFPGFPEGIGGFDLVDRFRKQAAKFGTKTVLADVSSVGRNESSAVPVWDVAAGGKTHKALAVIIATGASWRKLGVPGEDAFVGRGISYCATCDAPFFRDRHVAVVGGGDTAVQEAIYLTGFAKKVTLIHRRDRLRAAAVLRDRAMANPGITFVWNSVVEEIRGKDAVASMVIRNAQTPEQREEIPVDGVFMLIGFDPNTGFLRGTLDMDKNGYILTDASMRTSAAGLFACGDCRKTPLRQVVTACGDGATAAVSAQHYIENLKGDSY